ncbi:M23 family metallopeptidase [Mucilaginibacter hurinus]|uniref:M23 family metallopeptidase n=1 Tax=Mucilaginibacter hurinus TaxID=2201324 RepID=UPI001314C968|nr:M23 family metallopeptidase [Mucilaginibacter hurinus]
MITTAAIWVSCSDQGGMGIFKKQSPHEAYGQKLKDAGLDRTAIGRKWLLRSTEILIAPLNITIPYKETGYFAADKPGGTALRFEAIRGKKLNISLEKKPVQNYNVYVDLFQLKENNTLKLVASADTSGQALEYEIKQAGKYVIRLQPELLQSGEYTLTVTAGPSLGFPVSETAKPRIGSFWGDNRDDNGRKHEGIDIFAPKGTPAVAAANGTVNNVTENTLGGKVVFFRPENADYTLYYAHLDEQLVQPGQTLLKGDTVGLVGNTGNARNTPSHLHFGIYTFGGTIDPLAFVDKTIKPPPAIIASTTRLNATIRTDNITNKLYDAPTEKGATLLNLPKHAVLNVDAAAGSFYKVQLPDGLTGYISSRAVTDANILRSITLKNGQPLLNAPDSLNAPRKKTLAAGNKVAVLGAYRNYYLVKDEGETGWILQ